MSETAKLKIFLKLSQAAQKCRICPDLADKIAVLSEMNGNINPKVMFIAEAPGRQGGGPDAQTVFRRQIRREFSDASRFDKS